MHRIPAILTLLVFVACGGGPQDHAGGPPAGGRPGGSSGATPGGSQQIAAVPVEAAPAARRDIAAYLETNGVLEAENEVDIVARMTGPIVRLDVEEGMTVKRGQLLARIDDRDVRSELEISRVALEEARLDFERAKKLEEAQLISPEEYEQVETAYETAQARYEGNRILTGYTEIRAPFNGLIVARYIDLAQHVSANAALFRISDFDPLLCPIQVPERELPRLAAGQDAYLTVEAWPDLRFPARVLRISPVVDAATGTVKVTLGVEPDSRLRPGMFGRVFLETERRLASLVIPKAALSLESLGDTVYVVGDGVAQRRDVELGFREGDHVEVTSGLAEGELVVVVGQDGLSDGTPIQVLGDFAGAAAAAQGRPQEAGLQGKAPGSGARAEAQPQRGDSARPERGGRPLRDPAKMTPEQLERARELMRSRGLSEEEIEERLSQRQRQRQPGTEQPPHSDGSR